MHGFKRFNELTALVEGSQIKSAEIKIYQFLKLNGGSVSERILEELNLALQTDELIARLKEEEVPVFNKARVKRNQQERYRTGASFRFKETTGRVKSDFKAFVYHSSFNAFSDSSYS